LSSIWQNFQAVKLNLAASSVVSVVQVVAVVAVMLEVAVW
jgi:hypothetical protein